MHFYRCSHNTIHGMHLYCIASHILAQEGTYHKSHFSRYHTPLLKHLPLIIVGDISQLAVNQWQALLAECQQVPGDKSEFPQKAMTSAVPSSSEWTDLARTPSMFVKLSQI